MPQMSPLLWLSLYLYVLMLMMLFLMIIYYFNFNSFVLLKYNFMNNFYTYSFKW